MAASKKTIVQRIAIEGVEDIKARLKDLGVSADDAIKQIQKVAETASASGGQGIAGFIGGFREKLGGLAEAFEPVHRAFDTFKERASEFGSRIGEAGRKVAEFASIGAGFTLGALIEQVSEANEKIHELARNSETLGITSEQLQTLQLLAAKSGLPLEAFTNALTRMNRAVGDIITKNGIQDLNSGATVLRGNVNALGNTTLGASSAVSVLRGNVKDLTQGLGASITVLRGGTHATASLGDALDNLLVQNKDLGVFDKLKLLAQTIQGLENPAAKASAAGKIFGREWKSIVPIFAQGAAGIKTASDQLHELGITISDEEKHLGEAFTESRNVAILAAQTAFQIASAYLGQPLQKLFNGVETFIAENINLIREWASTVAQAATPVVEDLIAVLNGADKVQPGNEWILSLKQGLISLSTGVQAAVPLLILGFKAIVDGLELIAAAANKIDQVINSIFGTNLPTNLNAASIAVIAFVAKVSGAFGVLRSLVGLLASGIAGLIGAVTLPWALLILGVIAAGIIIAVFWDKISAGASAAADWISKTFKLIFTGLSEIFTDTVGVIVGIFQGIGNRISGIASAIASFFQNAWNTAISFVENALSALSDWFQNVANSIINFFTPVFNFLKSIVDLAGRALGGATTAAGGATQSFATGGRVRGTGSSTSDNVPIWASPGEWVVKAAAVRHYGSAFMDAVNNMRLGVRGMRFAAGGIVPRLVGSVPQRLAGGGAVALPTLGGGQRIINLTIDGQTFNNLAAPEDQAQKLIRFATGRKVRTAGRKPSWAG